MLHTHIHRQTKEISMTKNEICKLHWWDTVLNFTVGIIL